MNFLNIFYFYIPLKLIYSFLLKIMEIIPENNTITISTGNTKFLGNIESSESSEYIESIDSVGSTQPNTKLLSIQDSLLNDSRITPTGNGNPMSKPYCTQPTSGQKLWASVLLGFLFALISSPVAYNITSKVTSSTIGLSLMDNPNLKTVHYPNFVGLLIHTLIFIVIVRIILW